jgi:hypothetical protein
MYVVENEIYVHVSGSKVLGYDLGNIAISGKCCLLEVSASKFGGNIVKA